MVPYREREREIVPRSIDGTPPPYALHAEVAVFAAILIDHGNKIAFHQVAEFLTTECFVGKHRPIWNAFVDLVANGKGPDIVAVGEWLKARGQLNHVGGMGYLTEILNGSPAITNVRSHAIAVHDAWRRRTAAALGQLIAAEAFLGDAGNVQEWLGDRVAQLGALSRKDPDRSSPTQAEAIQELARKMGRSAKEAAEHGFIGLSTGLYSLDLALLGGLRAGKKYTLVASSGFGKTMLAEQIASHNASQQIGVLYLAVADMTPEELRYRQLSRLAHVDSRKIEVAATSIPELKKEEWARLTPAMQQAYEWPFMAVRMRGATIDDITTMVHRVANDGIGAIVNGVRRKVPLSLVIEDYEQRESAPKHRRNAQKHEWLSESTERKKQLAVELNIPMLTLAQPKPMEHNGKQIKPSVGDKVCKDCRAIDEESDYVLYLHADDKSSRDRTLIVLKGRNGGEGEIPLEFDAPFGLFTDPRDPARVASRDFVDDSFRRDD